MNELSQLEVQQVARELGLAAQQVGSVIGLLDDGNTVPFITRYRKEQTGDLDEVGIRAIGQRANLMRQLAERKATILKSIDGQNKLSPELRSAVEGADSLKRLEDLYLPFRPKRTSRASQARERGLEPLADAIWSQRATVSDPQQSAAKYVNPQQELPDADAVLRGVVDILSERISENPDIRAALRALIWKSGNLAVKAGKADAEQAKGFRDYIGYSESVSRIPPHRVLAINRGERTDALRVKLEWDGEQARARIAKSLNLERHRFRVLVEQSAAEALSRHIGPSLERELRRELTTRAETHAVAVFARNLRGLLLQPPVRDERVLAIDPGFRTGCKLAALDGVGRCLDTGVIYVTGSAEKKTETKQKLADFIREHECHAVAIGNGTACRETEELVSEVIAEQLPDVRYTIVNEAGASVYSASPLAAEEFPDFDATVRGTVSIGRRLQDPLSELVKIDPQHIGVGMYQHDVNPKRLAESLREVVESCVNYVGIDLNTASVSLLTRVSGFNQSIAKRIVEWRDQHGRFGKRRQLRDVPGIGEVTFTQSAGFLKIAGGDEPLDATWIHPESYRVAENLLERIGVTPAEWLREESQEHHQRLAAVDAAQLARELDCGLPTTRDIIASLLRPGRDPRIDLAGPVFKQGVLRLDDLHAGMELTGSVLNVVDFGAFVDIGLKDSGLVHISQMSNSFVRNPHDVVGVGDVVKVWVLDVEHERRRVALTMVEPGTGDAE